MKKVSACLLVVLGFIGVFAERDLKSAPEARSEVHRSPADVAVLPGDRLAVTANHTADSVSLIDLQEGKVLDEQPCGRKPAGLAASPDGRRVAVTNLWSDSITLFEVIANRLKAIASIPVGSQPRGIVFAPNQDLLFIALSGAHEVIEFNWPKREVVRRWQAPIEPRRLALSKDGQFLAAASARSGEVRCWDTKAGKEIWTKRIIDGFNLHGIAFSPDDKELVVPHCHDRHHSIAKHNIESGWAIDNRLTRLTLKPDPNVEYWQIALDVRSKAVGDPCAAAFSAKGDWFAVTAAGTQELLTFKSSAVTWNNGDPGDFIDVELELYAEKLRRVPLGGRPLAVQFMKEKNVAVVANYLADTVQLVDAATGKLERIISLGGPSEPSLARRGEAIFYDAKRSHHQWFSCHTCHPDGHTSGRTFDTLNDDSYGNTKMTPTLRGVTRTGPWTWHGWQDKLEDAISKSLTDTHFGKDPSAEDVRAVYAFLETLDHPPNPNRKANGSLSEAAERGRAIFNGKANCTRCHHGADFTAPRNYDVKLEADNSPFDDWNPPTLRGLIDRGPYLHHGRADTLDEVLRLPHAPEKLGGQPLTPAERKDLIEFLKTL